jgi:hypothetical protein
LMQCSFSSNWNRRLFTKVTNSFNNIGNFQCWVG